MHTDVAQIPVSAKATRCMSADDPLCDTTRHEQLIVAVALYRDREAFARLFDHFAPRLKAWLMRSGASEIDAEDFAQETMMTVWRKADLFDPLKAKAATWIFTIARNKRLDKFRRDSRPLPVPEITFDMEEVPRPDDLLASSQDAHRVRMALAKLNPHQIELLQMAFFFGRPHSEIASQLDLPLGTVKSRIRNAMAKLRQMLEPERDVL